jgi:hypothetical protein
VVTAILMRGDLGAANKEAKFRHMFSNKRAVNLLAAARVFLFASRDVWFVVGLPVFLYSVLGWTFWKVGAFMAVWVIGYGAVQATAPGTLRWFYASRGAPDGHTATWLAFLLGAFPAAIALALLAGLPPTWVVVAGLILFGIVFALNSAVHSFLILAYTDGDKVAMNVGFYYTASACGRLGGTVLSGVLYQRFGLPGCMWACAALTLATGLVSLLLPTAPPGKVSMAGPGDGE